MRRPRPLPRPPAQQPDDFDRMGWEVCKFGAGGATRGSCECQKRRVACCDSVRPTITAILQILTNARR